MFDLEKAKRVFTDKTALFKNSMRMIREKQNPLLRGLQNIIAFGFTYPRYLASRFAILRFSGDTRCKLFFGRELVLPRNDIGTHTLALYGIMPHRSERKLTLWMLNNLTAHDVLYDVGAHFGFYTALGACMLTKGEVHAFEANKNLSAYLRKNFGTTPHVHLTHTAIADRVGEVDFYDATDAIDSSASSRFDLTGSKIFPTKVSATKLDAYIEKGNQIPTVIKMDIEGGEYDALVGASKLLAHKPRIIMEVWGGDLGRKYSEKAVTLLKEKGYKAYALEGDGSISAQSIDDPLESISDGSHDARDNFLFIAD